MNGKPIDPQAAIQEIWDNSSKLAKARSERVYLEEFRKSLKAILMTRSAEKSAAGQERDAYAHPDYLAHLEALKIAVEAEEKLRWRMVASQAAIEVWRSQESSNRMIDRAAQ